MGSLSGELYESGCFMLKMLLDKVVYTHYLHKFSGTNIFSALCFSCMKSYVTNLLFIIFLSLKQHAFQGISVHEIF